jgi:hypothetical protein
MGLLLPMCAHRRGVGPVDQSDTQEMRTLLLAFSVISFGSFLAAQPANDNFADRIPLTGNELSVSGSNVGAVKEDGEPNHGGNQGGRSVWWSWTPASDGIVTIDTIGSSFNTTLGVYLGDAVNALSLVAGNNNISGGFGGNNRSRVTFPCLGGTEYQIAVDGNRGGGGLNNTANGDILLNLTNDITISTVFPAGSVWKYLDDGSDQGTAWRAPGFDDSAWASGPAQLGYGDGDETTVVSFGPDQFNKYITTYFRRTFTVNNPALITNLICRLQRDDGGIVYINGVEVFRSNMPEGEINYLTLAFNAQDDGASFELQNVSPSVLVAGVNVITVEIHQGALDSSDMSFDLELLAQGSGNALPAVAITSPANGALFRPGTNITITAGASDR